MSAIALFKLIKLLPILLLTSIISIALPILPALAQSRSNRDIEIVGVASAEENRLIQELRQENKEVGSSAAQALGSMGEVAILKLIPLLDDKDTRVRWRAAYTLGRIGKSAKIAIPKLMLMLNDRDENVRSSAAYALGSMGDPAKAAICSTIEMPA